MLTSLLLLGAAILVGVWVVQSALFLWSYRATVRAEDTRRMDA